ncbi:MAG: FAS1 domain-containing protein [Monoraphidium minutum]|nr:MAG: FAS1 domain-containing protein [Monoraphidium minutum]
MARALFATALLLVAGLASAQPALPKNGTARPRAAGLKLWDTPIAAAKANGLLAFASAAEDAGLMKALDVKDLVGTIFVPSDKAFKDLQDSPNEDVQKLLANKTAMATILKYHVVPGATIGAARVRKMVTDSKGGVVPYKSLQGERVNATIADDAVLINEVGMADTDVQGGKTMMHVIDGVLLPPSMVPESVAEEKAAEAESGAAALAAGLALAVPALLAALL